MSGMKGEVPWAPLLVALDANVRDALNQPLRREILRVLHSGDRPRTLGELTAEISAASVSAVNYHVQVLRRSGVVEGGGALLAAAGRHESYQSLVATNSEVLAVLRETEAWDRAKGERAIGRRPVGFLAGLRLPRSIRLGARRKRPGSQA